MRCFIGKLIAALVFMSFFTSANALEEIKVGTTTRSMIVYAPKNMPSHPALVIACHGANQDAAYLQGQAKWESVADTAKFVVVYPNGVNKYWNISGNSDIQFVETIINTMYDRYGINRNRVYLTGFSMGGMFTYYSATKIADKIAAFAPVSGYPMGGPNASASRPVPILHTHGTADDVCVYSSVQSHIDAWVRFNGCNTTPEVIQPYPKSKPNSPASLKRYRNGKNGVEVALLTLADKGHWWSMDPVQALTSEEVWNFCKRYSLGPLEPEIESVIPENNSFDMLPERDNTFVITFSEPVDCEKIIATLNGGGGAAIALKTVSTGFEKSVTFTLPEDVSVPDGAYTLNVSNAVSKEGGVMGQKSFTYVYGVEEVGESPGFVELFAPDWYASYDAIGEGIPLGWKRVNIINAGGTETTAGGTANCAGVRMKYFQKGGDFDAGFYLSARDNKTCHLYYGQYDGYRLHLKEGKYRITFNSVYWSEGALSANATYNFRILTTASKTVAEYSSLTSTGTMVESTARQIQGSKQYSFDFTIDDEADYVLDFEMSEGWNSVIFGNINLSTCPSLADTYKGTFYRTLLLASQSVEGYEDTEAGKSLMSVIEKYADLASTSPSVYTVATEELAAAYDKFRQIKNGVFDKVSQSMDIDIDGEIRSFWLYVPEGCKPDAPLVCALHGAGGHSTDNSPNFNSLADQEKFIVVYPQGKDIYFAVFGGTVPGWDASGEENGDTKFIKAVVDKMYEDYSIDRNRVYCCGFSNGGMMTYAMTNACADVFAAFASISGFPLNEFHLRHTGSRPVPFLHIHGKEDGFVKYSLMPVIVSEMVARNGAVPVPVRTSVSGKYDKSVYEAGEGGFPYIYYEIDGMGHNDFTASTEEGSSSATMWNFMKQYTLDAPCDTTLKWRPGIGATGYEPTEHGWTTSKSIIMMSFGKDQNTSDNQNVYYSLQLNSGNYKLKFRADGDEDKAVTVRIQKLTGNKRVVLRGTGQTGKDNVSFFKINDGWGEYQILFTKPSSSDNITISDIELYSSIEDEATGIIQPVSTDDSGKSHFYSLSGTPANSPVIGNINIVRGKDGSSRKILYR